VKALITKLSFSILMVLSLGFVSPAYAEEMISNFVSNIYINSNGSADITETIVVHAERKKIQYGIVRWMPKFYRDSTNKLTAITYFVGDVLMNNLPTPYHIIQNDNATAIFIGTPNRMIPPGVYTYLIQYHINNAVVLSDVTDQFYWNVTGSGNAWQFPIENVDATVNLPKGAFVQRYAGYTGKFTDQTKNFFVSSPLGASEVNFTTTKAIEPGEELTIGVSWPTGFVHIPVPTENLFLQFISNRGNSIAFFFLLLLLAYCSLVWRAENRPHGKVTTLFQPPEAMSPSALRYIQKMTFDNKALTVAIVSMAVKGYLIIQEDENKNFTLVRKSTDTLKLSRAEADLAELLFKKSDSITLDVQNNQQILQAQDEMKKSLRDEYEKTFFVTHASFLVPAFIIGFCGVLALALASGDLWNVFWTGMMLSLAAFYLSVQMPRASEAVKDFARATPGMDKSPMMGRLIVSLFLTLVLVIGIVDINSAISVMGMVLTTCILAIEVLFYHLLKAHTPLGRKLMDEVEGFKMYLGHYKQTQGDNKVKAPPKTIELYEKFLPYAIALDIEDRWNDQFTKVMAKASASARQGAYSPVWFVTPVGWKGNVTVAALVAELGNVWVLLYLAAVPRAFPMEGQEDSD
jgi:hypothetical protein